MPAKDFDDDGLSLNFEPGDFGLFVSIISFIGYITPPLRGSPSSPMRKARQSFESPPLHVGE